MLRRCARFICAFMLLLVLPGCGLKSPEELYTLPKPTSEYESLQTCLDELQTQGYEFAAPLAGSNTQSVQMEDLDGDGEDEAIAFFRDSSGEDKPLKICIFRSDGSGGYTTAAKIEGDGDAINSIAYCQMNTTDMAELVVGWRISTQVYALSVYSLENYNVTELLSAPSYSRYIVRDLDQDNQGELVLFQLATAEDGGNSATYYDWMDDTLMYVNTEPLSNTIASIQSMDYGNLRGGYPALYVSSTIQESSNILLTDVLEVRDDLLVNITMDNSGESSQTQRLNLVDICDIDNDNVLEIPTTVLLGSSTTIDNSESVYVEKWKQYYMSGREAVSCCTYHNVADGWYYVLPDSWQDNLDSLILSRSEVSLGSTVEHSITFYCTQKGVSDPVPFLTIYKNTGSNRVGRSSLGERFLLQETGDATYAAELYQESVFDTALTQQTVTDCFNLIVTDWSAE